MTYQLCSERFLNLWFLSFALRIDSSLFTNEFPKLASKWQSERGWGKDRRKKTYRQKWKQSNKTEKSIPFIPGEKKGPI